jgi:UDP-3-O-[3-hydroxymyristoyl] glucosamine N-acyltransferase
MNCFETISFLDDASPEAIGKTRDYSRFYGQYTEAFVAIGNSQVRMELLEKLSSCGYSLPVLRHPASVVLPSAQISHGCMIEPMAVVSANAVVEAGCLICAGVVVNHNARVGRCCQIDCNAVVASNAVVPEGTKVPCGTVYDRKN